MSPKRICSTIAVLAVAWQAGAAQVGQVLHGMLSQGGSTRIGQQPSAAEVIGRHLPSTPEPDLLAGKARLAGRRIPVSLEPPSPPNFSVTSGERVATGFAGLNALDQVLADNGNQYDLEPPDPTMAVGGAFVLQAVNDAVAVFDKAGHLLSGPTALNPFFGLSSEVVWDPNTGQPLSLDRKSVV